MLHDFGAHFATGTIAGFEHRHVQLRASLPQPPGHGQPGDPAADDHDIERFRSLDLMHVVDQPADIVDRGLRQDAMSQIEDVAGIALGLLGEDGVDLSPQHVPWGEQRNRIEIPLQDQIGANQRARATQIGAPVDADDRRASGCHRNEQAVRFPPRRG